MAKYTIEPHGKPGEHALYFGRDSQHHGLRLCTISDGDMNFDQTLKLIVDGLNDRCVLLKEIAKEQDQRIGMQLTLTSALEKLKAARSEIERKDAALRIAKTAIFEHHEIGNIKELDRTGTCPVCSQDEKAVFRAIDERSKETCEECKGKGETVSYGPYHGSISRCWKCNGEGRHL